VTEHVEKLAATDPVAAYLDPMLTHAVSMSVNAPTSHRLAVVAVVEWLIIWHFELQH
jgi:hypothetical protein